MKKRTKGSKRGGRGRRGGGALGVFRMTGRAISWNVQQTTSGNGGFSSQEAKTGASASNAVIINPFGIGGRLYYFASMFDEWKVNSLRFVYEPYIGVTGSPQTPAGTQNSGGLFERAIAMAFVADPATGSAGYNALVDCGGVQFRTSERKSISTKGLSTANWMYTSTSTSSSITLMDYRQTSPGSLLMAFSDTSTTNNVTYGCIRVEWDVSFRSPLTYGNPLGVSGPSSPAMGDVLTSTSRDESEAKVKAKDTLVDDGAHVLILRAEDLVEDYQTGVIPREQVVRAARASLIDAKSRFDALVASPAARGPGGVGVSQNPVSMALRAPSSSVNATV